MEKFNILKGIPANLPMINVDTDMIIPKQFLKTIKRSGLGKSLFFEMRYDENGKKIKNKRLFLIQITKKITYKKLKNKKLYDPKRIHRHKWQKGQLLIYNNKATNHKRENGGTKRHLWKIALYKR